ncbi:uncharacterized protein LOC121793391 [Salvia splendens]|uniref:uncharacterized protein LOC121793391 n=1 Tax=Salvia splendens TaxID=180675 RepID=UPI001C27FA25|nr:uncharacterized protein LOC121793391 [Salvia splendens]
MASLLSPPLNLPLNKANDVNVRALATKPLSKRDLFFGKARNVQFPAIKSKASTEADVLDNDSAEAVNDKDDFGLVGMHHVGILCENLERSLHFYQNILGLPINEARPHDKLPYRGAWLWVGAEMIHLMELPNPDPLTGRPEHGGRDRHACLAIRDVSKLKDILDKAGIPYTLSRSGRPAIFTRDPDANALEFTQVD